MDEIGNGIAQQGTFNGNPLVAAAGLAALTEVLTPRGLRLLRGARSPADRRLSEGDRRVRASRPT